MWDLPFTEGTQKGRQKGKKLLKSGGSTEVDYSYLELRKHSHVISYRRNDVKGACLEVSSVYFFTSMSILIALVLLFSILPI